MNLDQIRNLKIIFKSKSGSQLPKKIYIIYFNGKPFKMMKNAFYFILKALFLLEISKFLS